MHSRMAYLGLGITRWASSWTRSAKPWASLGGGLSGKLHKVNRKVNHYKINDDDNNGEDDETSVQHIGVGSVCFT